MKETKITFLILIFLLNLILFNNAFAYASNIEEEILVNKYGVKLTTKEYNFVTKFYGEKYFDNMTRLDYEFI